MTTLTRPLTTRALHLKITPRPSNLGETREILRLLSGFGEIEYYKSLKYEVQPVAHAALVIFREEVGAREALRRSPIRFLMGKRGAVRGVGKEEAMKEKKQKKAKIGAFGLPIQDLDGDDNMVDSDERDEKSHSSTTTSNPSFTSPHPTSDPDARIFQITTHPSTRNYRDHINVAHYHGPFRLDTKMFGQGDLVEKVPLKGLSCVDWRKEGKPWHVVSRERRDEREGVWRRRRLGELFEAAEGGKEVGEGLRGGELEDAGAEWRVGAGSENGVVEDRASYSPKGWGLG